MTHSEKLVSELEKKGAGVKDGYLTAFAYNLHGEEKLVRIDGTGVIYRDRLCLYEDGKEIKTLMLSDTEELKIINSVGAYKVVCEHTDGALELLFQGDMRTHREASCAVGYINGIKRDPDSALKRELVFICPKCGKTLRTEEEVCLKCVDKSKTFRRLWQVTKGDRGRMAASLLLFFGVTAISLLSPYIQRIFVDDYILADEKPQLFAFAAVVGLMFGVTVISTALSVARSYFLTCAGTSVVVRLRQTVFEKIEAMSLAGVSKRPTGELMGRLNGDSNVLQRFLTADMPALLEQLILFFFIGVQVVRYDYKLALLVIVPVPFVLLFYRLFWSFMRRMWGRQWVFETRSSTILYDAYQGIRIVKSFGMEHREVERYNKAVEEQRDISMKNEELFAVVFPIVSTFAGIGEFFLLYYVGGNILGGQMTFGEMAQFSAYVSMLYGPLRWMAMIPRRLVASMTSMVKMFEIIDEPADVPEAEHPVDRPIEGHIEFKDVSFGYSDGQTVLRHVSFEVKPGEMIGIVGRSGAGKSTLINLVMRLYDAESGQITVDGVDIRDISGEHLRSNIGVVLQETFLFSGTVYDNIAYAHPTATRSEVIGAAKAAGAHGFIMKLPDGYNTRVGEKGNTLSGGERQRIAIARALLHDPKILILDEATASLDTETEKQLQDALAGLMSGRTTIAIAHRLSTLRNAGRLIVIDKGTVAEQGSRDELMAAGGIYHDLVTAQSMMNKLS